MRLKEQFSMIFNGSFAFFQYLINFQWEFHIFLIFWSIIYVIQWEICIFLLIIQWEVCILPIFHVIQWIEKLQGEGGWMYGWTDRHTKFTPVSYMYRTSALWGRCPKRRDGYTHGPTERHTDRRTDTWTGPRIEMPLRI